MQSVADTAYPSYRQDYRAPDRCPSSAVLSASDDWIYPNYTVSPQAIPSRVQLPSMYTAQRPPDQSYPSPSPSVPSPGPRMSASLEYSSQSSPSTPPGADYASARDCQLGGPVRHSRTRQMSLSYNKDQGRRLSGDSQLGEFDPESLSRPQSPFDNSYDPSRVILGAGLSLSIPPTGMDNSHMNSPYQPATPNSIPSPRHHGDYHGSVSHFDGRPPSPAPSDRSGSASGSNSGLPSQYPSYPIEGLPPSHGKAPHSRVKKHTKKKLDALEKKRICSYHKLHQNARQEDIAELFGIERSTVSKILKHKSHWLQIDDNAEVQSKNRPSKFPILEDKMRQWLQECVDNDITITDNAIRKRALELATHFCMSEDKFKASAGWIENFKHRHQIRGGKWTQVPKRSELITPGVNNHANLSVPLLPDNADDRPFKQAREKWVMPGEPSGPRSGSPTAILQYHRSELAPPVQNDEDIPYAPLEREEFQGPTLSEAEEAATTLIRYLHDAPEGLVTPAQMNTLVAVKCALFQFASGVPYDTTLMGDV